MSIVGQNVQAAAADARAEATYNDAAAVLEEANRSRPRLAAQDAAIERAALPQTAWSRIVG